MGIDPTGSHRLLPHGLKPIPNELIKEWKALTEATQRATLALRLMTAALEEKE